MSEKWTSQDIPELNGKVAIVTGANTGLGLETTRELVRKNARVVMACRSTEKAETALKGLKQEIATADIKVMALDLSSITSIQKFSELFKKQYSKLDLLINNAGVMMPPYTKTQEGFELQFGTNHLGHFVLTSLLMDYIMDAKQARIVNVSSVAHNAGKLDFDDLNWEKRPYHKMKSYGDSKIANLYFTYALQGKLKKKGSDIKVMAAHPGWSATDLQRHSGAAIFMNKLFAQKPELGALPTLMAATSPDAEGGAFYGPEGFMELRGYPKKVNSNALSRDETIAEKLWQVSETMTGITFAI